MKPQIVAAIGVPVAAKPSEPGAVFVQQAIEATRQLLPLPVWLASYPLALTSPSARQALWARGRKLTGNDDLGFAVAERMRLEMIDTVWPVFETAPSLRALSESYAQWRTLLFDFMEPFTLEEGDRVRLCLRPPPGVVVDRGDQDSRAASVVRAWRAMTRRTDFTPIAVRFTYPRPRSVRQHVAALGACELEFSQPQFEMELSRQVYTAALPGADREAFARLHAAACDAARLQQARGLAAQADALVTWLLAGPGASAQTVARKLGLSARTLQRRLSEQGGSFRELVDGVRQRELALFLETGLYSMKQVARQLGFANDRALRLAVRRWQTQRRAPRAAGE
jgi:AraC-like DNA-binding protein